MLNHISRERIPGSTQIRKRQCSFHLRNIIIRSENGEQVYKALQEEFPGIVVFSLRELSDFQEGSPFSAPIFSVRDKQSALNTMKEAWWGLHIPFYVGIMDAIDPQTTFIDGNEEAYYYTSPLEYYEIRNILIDDAKALIPYELWTKHTSFLQDRSCNSSRIYPG